jgi:hypothetical protein
LPDVEEHDAQNASGRRSDRRLCHGVRPAHHDQRGARDTSSRDPGVPAGYQQPEATGVIRADEPPRRRNEIAREPWREINQPGGTNQADRPEVGGVPARLRGAIVENRGGKHGHARRLHERHQRNGNEIEEQTGEGDAREKNRARRCQRDLGADGGNEQAEGRLYRLR